MIKLVPKNLSVFGRASLLVVAIELLTSTTQLVRNVSKLVRYELKPETDSMYFSLTIFAVTISVLIFMFDILLYVGVRKGHVRWLAFWYKFGIFILMLAGVGAIIAAVNDEDGVKSTSDLIVYAFEIWIVSEYCKELRSGYIVQAAPVVQT